MRVLRAIGTALALCVVAGGPPTHAQGGRGSDHWVGTWATAVVARPQGPPAGQAGQGAGRGQTPPVNFNNQTLRQIVHASIGGDRVRVVLTNAFGAVPLAVGAASVALRQRDSAIVASSSRALTFGGTASTMVAAGAIAVSDPVNLAVPAFADLAIDIFLPADTGASSSPLTTHAGALQTSYVSATGNHVGATDLPVVTTTQSWFFLSAWKSRRRTRWAPWSRSAIRSPTARSRRRIRTTAGPITSRSG